MDSEKTPVTETPAEKPYPHRRHVILWKILRPICIALSWIRFGFIGRRTDVKGPYLVISNHNTDWDPILVAGSFPDQMYYVGSEHIMRSKAGRLLAWLQDPIPRQKGGRAADTVMTVMRRLKKGYNVAIFAEGNRSWDGLTRSIPASTGKLARSSGAALVTYRIEGAYFASPRWSGNTARRGRVRGHVVHVYSPAELKAMKPAEIQEHICQDLQEDAYDRQRKDPVPFRGRRLAEHMETALFICPHCGRTHSLFSKKDTVLCPRCGFTFRYLTTGFLAGENLPWDNVRDALAWQDGEIRRMCESAGSESIFSDDSMRSYEVHRAEDSSELESGEIRLYRDRLEIPGVVLPLENITGMSIRGAQDLYIGTSDHTYLVRSRSVRNVLKYLTACSILTGNDYGV